MKYQAFKIVPHFLFFSPPLNKHGFPSLNLQNCHSWTCIKDRAGERKAEVDFQHQRWCWRNLERRQRAFALCREMVTLPRIVRWLPHQPQKPDHVPGYPFLSVKGLSCLQKLWQKKGHLGFLGSPNRKGSLVKYVSRLVAMEIRCKDSPSQGTLTSTDRKSGFDLSI